MTDLLLVAAAVLLLAFAYLVWPPMALAVGAVVCVSAWFLLSDDGR